MALKNLHVPVVFDHEDFLVVHKPPDCAVTRNGDDEGLLARLRRQSAGSNLIPVHRLDKVTSGLWLLAKNTQAARDLTALFRERAVRKCYLALSDRKPHKKQGLIIGDMVRSRDGRWKICLSRTAPAVTRFISRSMAPCLRLFALFPETGKTHQIRVAMKCLGAPILGDPLYGHGSSQASSLTTPPDRTYLHAYALAFAHKGVPYAFIDPPRHGRLFLDPAFHNALQNFTALIHALYEST
ncbi:tRNA pseudouridine32 synthase/23S rRNA pseudouridine746 synthase [Desulfosoma caldarium]|uniref:tRNA pseudouridine32 synthase/23S rRNA pseudouridine746 synthase n=2 Tax=Desulfosoma caldarium TaxID=610254 RepID=A0A3N1UT76_9BACT|nr:tRNA pseudouridine32 synthase/23S rRNA pseudouridine746 synthase [Desulfosoma caldarium]